MGIMNGATLSREHIGKEVRAYITEYFLLGATVDFADDTSLLEAGILDSTGATELVAFLEATYGLVIEDEELVPDNLDSVDKISAFVCRKQHAPVAPAAD